MVPISSRVTSLIGVCMRLMTVTLRISESVCRANMTTQNAS